MIAKNATIMIVDDMKMIRTSIRRYLTNLGYSNFVEASSGNEAVTKVKAGGVDFVFMDVVMPNLNGNEALKKIREVNPFIPVCMLSSVADEDVINECKGLGIVGYILKPINADTGPQTLENILKQA